MYRGRFAPTPSGELHLGSLVTAVASFLDARAAGGEWLVRIEDVDSQRSRPYFESSLLRELERHALFWDGPVVRQSERLNEYCSVLEDLFKRDVLFPCDCSKSKLALRTCPVGPEGEFIYDGHCRSKSCKHLSDFFVPGVSVRLRVGDELVSFHDGQQGVQSSRIARDSGDFVLRRGDGCFAYHLAVVVDDQLQGVTHIVRGEDILPLTFRHIYLQKLLGFSQPSYTHVPLVYSADGSKLSKSSSARALREGHPSKNLLNALEHLGIQLSNSGEQSCSEILSEALEILKTRAVRSQV